MFSQYKASKATIRRNYVINLLNGVWREGLLQDALGLLYLDLADNRPDNHVMKYIIRQWDSKALPDPFEQKDQATIAKLYQLFSSMSMFVEDYISKAASPNPPQAYLCLPQIADPNKGLYYKEHSFSPRHVTLDELTLPECHFLMWAFIKYDIIFKIQGPKAALVIDDNEQGAISKKEYEALTDCEHEALHSVLQYVDAAYGALFTMGLGHFPTIEELAKQSTLAPEFEERRQRRHLQLCQFRREAGIEDTPNEGREYIFSANDEDSIPRLFDPSNNREVTTFWQHI
ncbi:hypothetical protein FBULB1_4111 [Fusarium bulbicola]|nr:hypothetical protein FBULB1_4111 [Fusarium bulbicola]